MKTLPLLLILLSSFTISAQTGNSLVLDQKGKEKLPLKSGKISYSITGGASGSATLYFDRNGWRQMIIRELTFERYGMKSTEKTIEYIDGDLLHKANLDSKKGLKSIDGRWSELITYKPASEIPTIILEDNGGLKKGEAIQLNYPVTIWEFTSGARKSVWEWNGIILKEYKSLGDLSYQMTAETFLENEPIPEEVFALPENITWKMLK
jgi:hypothetical protein